MPEVMEIQVEELSEIKTSKPTEKNPQGAKYFVVNKGQFICFKTDLHPVFTALQGKSIKCNVYPGKDDKSARIDSLYLTKMDGLPHKEVKAPPDEPQQATATPKPPTAPPPSTSRRPPLDDKTRGVSLSYAKDMAVAKIIEKEKILDWAAIFATFIDGNIEIDDLKVLELVRTKLFKTTE